jgi:hypothetical protein
MSQVSRRDYLIKKLIAQMPGEIIQLKKLIAHAQVPRQDYTIEKIDCAGAATRLYN